MVLKMSNNERERFLFINIMRNQVFSKRDLINALRKAVLRLYGENGASRVNLRIIRFDPEAHFAVLRCSNKMLNYTRAAIASVTKINNENVSLSVVRVSGTIRTLMRKVSQT
jgi:RNase P/RNase MRP subunit POP5